MVAIVLMTTAAMAAGAPLALGVDPRQNSAGFQVHHDALVKELVNHKYDPAHVLDQALSLNAFAEDAIEALMHAVKQLAQNQLVVIYMPNNKDGHV